jgi:RNA recognition motif-containing protein
MPGGGQVSALTAYDCLNKSNVIESYSPQEPNACASSDKASEVEITVYGEIVQIKQDRMIPVFRCQVIRDHSVTVLWHALF